MKTYTHTHTWKIKALAVLLVSLMLACYAPWSVFAEWTPLNSDDTDDDTVYVLAGADFQPNDDNVVTGQKTVNSILTAIREAGYESMDGFLFAGDYDLSTVGNTVETLEGMLALQEEVRSFYGDEMHEVYCQGNHDAANLIKEGFISSSGANDSENYGVFVINEKDYMWGNVDEAIVQATAESLKGYLDEKLEDGYEKPIFIVSHLPLHYTMRTYSDGDSQYANYLFNVINAAAAEGLYIFFLFGHNHARGYDDYLGGASLYLEPGDNIQIAQGNKEKFTTETLAFTYLNAGYVGYYAQLGSGVDSALTMTVFAITEDRVRIERYSADGLHDLKAEGNHGSYTDSEYEKTAYPADRTVYSSPRTVYIESFNTVSNGDVTVTACGITSVAASFKEESRLGYSRYVEYDLRAEGIIWEKTVKVTVRLKDGYDQTRPIIVIDLEKGKCMSRSVSDGAVTFTISRLGKFALVQIDQNRTAIHTVRNPGYKVFEPVDKLVSGEYYVIRSVYSGYVLTTQCQNDQMVLDGSDSKYEHLWYYEKTTSQGVVGRYLRTSADGSYLSLQKYNKANLQSTPQNLVITQNNDGLWTIQQERFLVQSDPADTLAGTTNKSGTGNFWLFGKIKEYPPRSVTLTVTPGVVAMDVGKLVALPAEVLENGMLVDSYEIEWISDNPSVATVENGVLEMRTAGLATVTASVISVNGKPVETQYRPQVRIPVVSVERNVVSVTLDRETVTAGFGTSLFDEIASATVFFADGTSEVVSVTPAMLEGSYNLRKTGTYRGLVLKWQELVLMEQFVLTVTAEDYPTYPTAGSVKINKTVIGSDFASSGIAQIELSVSGMAVKLDRGSLPAMTDAVLLDVLSGSFRLMMGDSAYDVASNSTTATKARETSIAVLAYKLYTREDVDGVSVTDDMIGTRKGDPEVVETITFNQSGTEAYSDRLEGNVLREGIICAQNFFYNTLKTGAFRDTDGDGENDTVLEANTLYWNIGSLYDTELTLTYYVYLNGSMEGTRETGDYTVGQEIGLNYMNWMGKKCQVTAEAPSLFWNKLIIQPDTEPDTAPDAEPDTAPVGTDATESETDPPETVPPTKHTSKGWRIAVGVLGIFALLAIAALVYFHEPNVEAVI